MSLHIINKAPLQHKALDDCLRLCSPESSIIFIEDGVYAVLQLSTQQKQLLEERAVTRYVLEADIAARGLIDKVVKPYQLIDDNTFVELVVQHTQCQSWF